MYRRLTAVTLCLFLLAPTAATAHDGAGSGSALGATNLRDLISNFLIGGITLARPEVGEGHAAHFIADSEPLQAIQRLNQDLGIQLSAFPLSSSSGGFTYTFDPTLGVFTRSTDSFGPIYAERHNTLGKGRLNVGVSFSHYTFDELDDLNLRDGDVRLVFEHIDGNEDGSNLNPFFEGDLVTTQLYLKMQSTVTAFVATIGATDRLDFGLALPLVDIDLQLAADAQVKRISTGDDSEVHQFENGSDETSFTESGSATGLGDVVLRAKYRLAESETGGAALAADVRAPTGEERDLLGSGEWQFRGSFIAAGKWGAIYPHLNASFAGATGDASNEAQHLVGFDWAVSDKVTFAADLQGRYLLNALKVSPSTRTFESNTNPDPTGTPIVETTTAPSIGIAEDESRYSLSGLVGVKVNLAGNLLLSVNGLIALGSDGLTDKFTPLVGVDYSF